MVRLSGLAFLAFALPAHAETYVDRVLDDGPQPALVTETELSSAGWPRGWRAEYFTASERGDQRSSSQGLSLSGFLDTPDYGALSLSAGVNRSRFGEGLGLQRGASHLWRIDQTGMPLDGGWLANHSAGDLSSLQVPMARGFGRIGLPSSPIEGVTAQYGRGPQTQVSASLGRPGVYSGLGVNGFNAAHGRLAFAGAQSTLGSALDGTALAFQVADASGLADGSDPLNRQSSRGLWGAWRWQGRSPWSDSLAAGTGPIAQRQGGLEVQANLMSSQSSRDMPSSQEGRGRKSGAWIDTRWRDSWLAHSLGLFYLQPALRWGSYNAIADLRGGYWRGEVATRRWQLNASAEWTDSVEGASRASSFANVSGRYRVDTRQTALGAVSLRRGTAPGESAQLGWELQSGWGQTQWRGDLLRTLSRRSIRLGMDHSFILSDTGSLAVSLATDRSIEAGRTSNTLSWGVLGNIRPWSNVTLDANLRGARTAGAQQINGNIGVGWAMHPNWTLLAQLSSSRGEDPESFALVSALTQAAVDVAAPRFSATRLQMTLRYEDRAGRALAPIGGAPGSGAGGISGFVFFDANNNSRREASEAGVPDIAIRLNGRFVTRTDRQGRYEFPAVVAGAHRLEIISDNVPLPWSPAQRDPQTVEVLVRGMAAIDFALQRDP
ncbi:MAG: hypothetical protein ABI919_07015 [Ramlibacter sp.]